MLEKRESVLRLSRERNEASSRADKLTKEMARTASARDAAVDRYVREYHISSLREWSNRTVEIINRRSFFLRLIFLRTIIYGCKLRSIFGLRLIYFLRVI